MIVAALFAGVAHAQIVQFSGASALAQNTWLTAKIGAGGFSTGIDIECDQGYGACTGSGTTTKVVRTDTYGAYIWNSSLSVWQQLLNSTTLPSGDPMNAIGACINSASAACGIYEIRIAPSNTKILYMVLNGYVYKGTNNCTVASPCVTWAATSFTQENAYNNNDRWWGPKLAIDPADANDVIFCSEGSGCQQSSNGGTTAAFITGLTNASSDGMYPVFDPSTTSGGSTPGIYIASYGNGVYHTTGGLTGSWTLTTSTPTTVMFMLCTGAGKVFLVGNNGGTDQTLYEYGGSGSWSSVTAGSSSVGPIIGVAVNPSNASDVVVVNQAGQLTYSTNGGTSFGGYLSNSNITLSATDIPWLSHTSNTFVDIGQMAFDAAQSNTLILTAGFDVWTTSGYTGGSSVTYTSQGAGMEQLVATWAISPWVTGSTPLFGVRDQQIFYMSSLAAQTYPTFSQHGGSGGFTNVVAATGEDWATGTPADILCACTSVIGQGDFSSYSTNGGLTWGSINAIPSGLASSYYGAMVARGSPSTAIMIPYNGPLNVGNNSGTNSWSWSVLSCSGISGSAPYGWGTTYNTLRQIVVADRVNADTYYAFNYGGNSTAGVYKISYSAGSWSCSRALTGNFDNYDGHNGPSYSQMRSVPGNAGEFMYSSGLTTPGPYPISAEDFYDCQDTSGTVTCTAFSNIRSVWAFGLGAAKPGGSGFPAIYIAGWANCGQTGIQNCGASSGYTYGIWRSPDHGSTWYDLGIPRNSLDTVNTVEGDGNSYGEPYVGFSGSGYAFGQFNFLLNRDIDPASNDNSPAFLRKVG